MAQKERPSFEREWPELSARVDGSLRRRGVPPWLRDDIVQETGLRLFRMWDNVDYGRSPYGLALTVANNLLWDSVQRHRDREVLGDIPDTPGNQDVERASIARLELARVGRTMRNLSNAHRSVLLAEVDEEVERPAASPAAVKMLRMRARRRLNALLEQASAVGAFAGWGIRKRALRIRAFLERNHLAVDGAAAAVTGFVATVTIVTGVSVIAHANAAPDLLDPGAVNVRATAAAARHSATEARTVTATTPRRSPAGSDLTAEATTDERTQQRYEVAVPPGGPVEGGAQVTLSEGGGHGAQVTPPDCSVDRPSESEASASCKGSVNSTEVDATVTVGIRP